MRQVPVWVRTTFWITAVMVVFGLFVMNFVKVPERKVFEPRLERPPILAPLKLELTPAASATALPSFPARGHEAAVEKTAVSSPEGEMTSAGIGDTETCRKLRAANPQTPQGAVEMYPGVPIGLVQLVTYNECEKPWNHAVGAFYIWSTDKEYTLRVPQGGEIVDYTPKGESDKVPPKLHCYGDVVTTRIMLVRGISLDCGSK